MRLVDAVLRQGHLSERDLTEALLTGERPAHLDRCAHCAERALALNRWLDDVRLIGLEAADKQFPAEMLLAQQGQIRKRLEALEQPASKVVAFPGAAASGVQSGRRVAPAWVGVAAAAGLVLGVIGGQITARLATASPPISTADARPATTDAPPVAPWMDVEEVLQSELDHVSVPALEAINQSTPRISTNSGG